MPQKAIPVSVEPSSVGFVIRGVNTQNVYGVGPTREACLLAIERHNKHEDALDPYFRMRAFKLFVPEEDAD
jgi:hypothetical protein